MTGLSEEESGVAATVDTGELLRVDHALIGIGIVPNTSLAVACGLRVANGIVVYAQSRTSDPDIFAAGDVASHPSGFAGVALPLESWANAVAVAVNAPRELRTLRKMFAATGVCARPSAWAEQRCRSTPTAVRRGRGALHEVRRAGQTPGKRPWLRHGQPEWRNAIAESLIDTPVRRLLDKVAGSDSHAGDERLRKIVHRVASDICRIVEEFDVTPTEFWSAVSYLTRLGQANEVGLLVPGLGIEHFLDLMTDEKERRAGLQGRTPRTIEGPLYIADAPLSNGEARLDQDPEQGEVLFMEGQVKGADGKPIAGAIVDVWHANAKGGYSHFDPSQSAYNLRRRIATDAEGRYRFRSILPAGYGCPPDGPTQLLLTALVH